MSGYGKKPNLLWASGPDNRSGIPGPFWCEERQCPVTQVMLLTSPPPSCCAWRPGSRSYSVGCAEWPCLTLLTRHASWVLPKAAWPRSVAVALVLNGAGKLACLLSSSQLMVQALQRCRLGQPCCNAARPSAVSLAATRPVWLAM